MNLSPWSRIKLLREVGSTWERLGLGDATRRDGTGPNAYRLYGIPLPSVSEVSLERREWADLLVEQLTETLHCVTQESTRAGLVRLAALCAAWVEDLDRRPS